jgi:GAF domain-containing protein
VTLEVKRDQTVALTTAYKEGRKSVVQTGTWKAQGNRLTVDLDRQDGRRVRETLVLERRGAELVAVDWDRRKYGQEGFRVSRVGEVADLIGTYRRSYVGSEGRVEVTLEVKRDQTVVLTTGYEEGRKPVVQTGTWKAQGNRLTVDLDRQDGRRVRETLVLERRGAELVAVDWDREKYGQEGFRVTRVEKGTGGLGDKGKQP